MSLLAPAVATLAVTFTGGAVSAIFHKTSPAAGPLAMARDEEEAAGGVPSLTPPADADQRKSVASCS